MSRYIEHRGQVSPEVLFSAKQGLYAPAANVVGGCCPGLGEANGKIQPGATGTLLMLFGIAVLVGYIAVKG